MYINMPVMDGIEATKKIKATMPKVCIIGLSLNNGQEVSDRMKQAGASAYLNKKKVSEKLVDLIEKEAHSQN
jgi:two-component system nitrate/nitrite response regulator NarL